MTYRTEGVVLVAGTPTFDGRRRATDCFDWAQLRNIGPSRGQNRIIPGTAGTLARPHLRGELAAELQWRLHGDWTTAGVWSPDGARDRVDAHLDALLAFVDGATGRQLQVRLYRPGGQYSTTAVTFKASGRIRVLSPTIYEVALLFAVPSGRVLRGTT